MSEVLDLNARLAIDRTVLAYERTYTAWIRTGLGGLGSALGGQALLRNGMPGWIVDGAGTVLVLFSAFCFLSAMLCQRRIGGLAPKEVQRFPSGALGTVSAALIITAAISFVGVWLV